MVPSERFEHAFKTALAIVIAYAIALHMDWEKPSWAAWTAFSISLATRGEGVHKGLMRLAGGLVGAAGGFLLLAFFIQDRWLFISFLSLYAAIFTYLGMGTRRYNYFWQQAGFFATVIAFDSAFSPSNAFNVGIERAQETGTGLLTYIVVGLLLWPKDSRRDLEDTTSKLFVSLRQLWQDCSDHMRSGEGVALTQGFGDQVIKLRAQFDELLSAAEIDSWQVAEMRPAWRRLQLQIADLIETLVRWRHGFDEVQVRNFERLAPGLPEFLAEIDRRLGEIEGMLAGMAPTRQPAPSTLVFDEQGIKRLSNFDRAALAVEQAHLQHIEAVSRALFETVMELRGFDNRLAKANSAPASSTRHQPIGLFELDYDRLGEAIRIAASVWLMFLAVVYIPGVPAGLGTLGIATRLVLADTAFPSISVTALFGPLIAGMLCAFPFYILVMPQLSSFPELAIAIFIATFSIGYFLHLPKQALWRTLMAYLLLSLISITNEQSYSFLEFATTATMWLVIVSVMTVTEYVPVPHQPDRVFLRLLNRFFRSAEFLMGLGRISVRELSPWRRLRSKSHTHEVATLPTKLAVWGRALPTEALGRSTPEQLQTLVTRLQGLSYRMQALLEARLAHQSAAMVRELGPDVRAWRLGVEEVLRDLAINPGAADHEGLESRLQSKLTRLEARIETALAQANELNLSVEERENMFRLLSAHRGVSESLVQFARQAAAIDWERLKEARF